MSRGRGAQNFSGKSFPYVRGDESEQLILVVGPMKLSLRARG